jgi:hypothetical protein
MLYVQTVEEDKVQHAKICQMYTLGVPLNPAPLLSLQTNHQNNTNSRNTSSFIVPAAHGYILEIRPSASAALLEKLDQVLQIVNQELGFVPDEKRNESTTTSGARTRTRNPTTTPTAYLYLSQKRVVGVVTVQRNISHAYALLEDGQRSTQRSHAATLGIYQLWTHASHRHKRIAQSLVDMARSKMIFGMHINRRDMAISSPTQAGLAFWQRYQQEDVQVEVQVEVQDGTTNHNDGNHKTLPQQPQVWVYDCV